MPSTGSGKPYTTTTEDMGTLGVAHFTVADEFASGVGLPAILYFHGSQGQSDQMVSLALWVPMRDWLLDNGFVIVEGSGGEAYGAGNWGNTTARVAYMAYLDRAKEIYDISAGKVVGFARSMGGLVGSWLYAKDTTGTFAGLINNSGVSTLFVGDTTAPVNNTTPPQIERSSGRYFTTAQYNAWGTSNYDDWAAAVSAADAIPENWPQSDWAGKNVLFCYGDADTTVPWYPRGGDALVDSMGSAPAILRVSPTAGGGHGGSINSYADLPSMTRFLTDILELDPPEPVVRTSYRVIASYIVRDGLRHRVHPIRVTP